MDFENCPMATGIISKITTDAAGGWSVKLNFPQTCKPIIQQLIGTENTVVYNIPFCPTDQVLEIPSRGPGRPKKE